MRKELDEGWYQALCDGTANKSGMAEALHNKYPLLFETKERARKSILAVTTQGTNRGYSLTHPVKLASADWGKSQAEPFEPFILDHVGRVGVLSDIHLPYQDDTALMEALDGIQREGCDVLYMHGDVMDCYQVSRHSKDPRRSTFMTERDIARSFLEYVSDRFERVIWKLGNHEDRWDRFLLDKAPQLFGSPYFGFNKVLGFEDYGVELVEASQIAKFGKLNVLHGHEFGHSVFSPVNPARGLFMRAKTSALCGHHHQSSEHHENNLNDTPMKCVTTGCLCSRSPEYSPLAFTKWNHGYAIVEIDSDGWFDIDNRRILSH